MTLLRGFILIFIASYFNSANTQMQCYTPSGLSSTCVDIRDCASLFSLLSIRRNQAQTNLLRDSGCGFIGSLPKVCCPPEEIDTMDRISTDSSSLLPKSCGKHDSESRIKGGNETGIGEFPWMALIEYKSKLLNIVRPYCGGALITSKYVLTAGHCIIVDQTKTSSPLNVRLGEHDTRTLIDCREAPGGGTDCNYAPVIIPIASYVAHPQYNSNDVRRRNDIGIIRMLRAVPFTDFVQPICLPTAELSTAVKELFVAGWGQTENEPRSPIKLAIKVNRVENAVCQRAYTGPKYGVSLWEKQTCAGGEDKVDSCGGDSGGPLMYNNVQIPGWEIFGVVSFGPTDCGQPGIPGVYTRVFSYRSWIISQLKP